VNAAGHNINTPLKKRTLREMVAANGEESIYSVFFAQINKPTLLSLEADDWRFIYGTSFAQIDSPVFRGRRAGRSWHQMTRYLSMVLCLHKSINRLSSLQRQMMGGLSMEHPLLKSTLLLLEAAEPGDQCSFFWPIPANYPYFTPKSATNI
jgi:hypothetical protein